MLQPNQQNRIQNIKNKNHMWGSPQLRKTKSLKQGAYQYDQKDKLGQGSFAKVYKGIITKNKRVVAIRLLPLTLLKQYGDKIKQIITGEVTVLKELSMSDSVDAIFTTRIYDCFITQNNVVMILEYCPEGNLQDILKKGPLQEARALQILYQLARGLQFIAKQKVVHRDIKPDNVFIKKQKNHILYKLGDFGFAVKKQLNSQIVGTPIFMSPELFRQQNYGSEVDVWAFGIMTHYCLFKQFFFNGNSEMQVKKKVLGERYELKKNQLNKLSPEMALFLKQCLQFNKNDRLRATEISKHPVFNPVRQRVQNLVKQVVNIQSQNQSKLVRHTVKGKMLNQIIRYSFLIDLANTFYNINSCNYASLYMLKHALGQLTILNTNLQNRVNIVNHGDWGSFCVSEDYQKSLRLIKALLQKCQSSFQSCYNTVISAVTSNYGNVVANGIKQNLGTGPYDRIKPQIITYQLQNNWLPWLNQNKNPQTHLLGLQLILSLFIYRRQPLQFDYNAYEMQKNTMNVQERAAYLEERLSNR